MADVEPPPNPDGMHQDDVPPSLSAFDAAVKQSASGTGRNGAAFRELHTFKTSLYFSIDNPVAGSTKVRNAFDGWLSQVNSSSELQGTTIIVNAMNDMPLVNKQLPTTGGEFERLTGWEKVPNSRYYRNVFICVNISTHVKFSNLKHSIIKYLLDQNIQMERNHSQGNTAIDMASIGYLGLADPDGDLQEIELGINRSAATIVRTKYNPDQMRKLGFPAPGYFRGQVALSHGPVKGLSQNYGKVTNPRAVIISCPKSQLEFYLRHLQEAIADMAWSTDLKKLRFVPFAMKSVKAHHDAFTNMLMYSAKELAKKTTVQILGVGRDDMMNSIRKDMTEACPSISHVEATDRTESQGRWKLTCDKTKVEEVESWVSANLERMCNALEMRTEIPGFDEPRLVSLPRVPTAQITALLDTSQEVFCVEDPENYPSLTIKKVTHKTKKQGAWKTSPTLAQPPIRRKPNPVPTRGPSIEETYAVPQGTTAKSPTSTAEHDPRKPHQPTIGIDRETQQTLKNIGETLQAQKQRIEENRDQSLAQQRLFNNEVAQMRATVADQSTAVKSFCQVIQQVSDSHAALQEDMKARDRESREMRADIKKLTENMDSMLQALREITADPAKMANLQQSRIPKPTKSPPPRAYSHLESDSDDASQMETSSDRESALTARLPESPAESGSSKTARSSMKPQKKLLPRSSRRSTKHKSARTMATSDAATSFRSDAEDESYDEQNE